MHNVSNKIFLAKCSFLPHSTSPGSPATLKKKEKKISYALLGITLFLVVRQ
jgi:hypothetical protein